MMRAQAIRGRAAHPLRRMWRSGAPITVAGMAQRFVMREKLLSIGDDFWIEDDRGERVYKVNGKALHVRKTFVLEDPSGDEVARIQERKLSVRDKVAIERGGEK